MWKLHSTSGLEICKSQFSRTPGPCWRIPAACSRSMWTPRTTTKTRVLRPKHAPHGMSALEGVPEVTHRPREVCVSSLPGFNKDSCQFIVFDLETTSLKTDADICQIAALRHSQGDAEMWSEYVLPTCSIEPGASLVTGLVLKYAGNDRYLTHCGKYVKALPQKEGIMSFYQHLKELSIKARHTIFIGFCSKTFDVPVLCNSFRKVGITGTELDKLGIGFTDAMAVLKHFKRIGHPVLNKTVPLESNTLSDFHKYLFNNESFRAHNAIADVKALTRILFQSPLQVSSDLLLSYSTTACSAFALKEFNERKNKLLNTMNGRLYLDQPHVKLVISRHMANKIASSGLSYADLHEVYRRYGREGIARACRTPSYSPEGKMTFRVTNATSIINDIVEHFENLVA